MWKYVKESFFCLDQYNIIYVILAIKSTSRTVIPNYHKMCGFSLSFIFFEAMMLHFSLAYQYLLSKSLTSYSSSMIFPFTCVAAS